MINLSRLKLDKIRKMLCLVNYIRVLCIFGLIGLVIAYHFMNILYYMVIWIILVVILIISVIGIRCENLIIAIYQQMIHLRLIQTLMWEESKGGNNQ